MINNILEISKRASKGGRVPIKIALLKIHEDINETNKNGIHWELEYVQNTMDSAKMMPICAEFCDETKSVPLGHGLTETVVTENGIKEPIFQDSETVGVIEEVSIEDITYDDVTIKVLCGSGYLFSQRYPNFVKWVRQNYVLDKVDTSIEIMGLSENDNKIKYLEDEPTDEYRTPVEYIFTGTAVISLAPADDKAIVLEVAQKQLNKEDKTKMEFDMNEIKSVLQSTIMECNAQNETYVTQISELNQQLEEKENCIKDKDNEICTLTANIEQVKQALKDLQDEHETYWAERNILEQELAKLRAEKRIGELNTALNDFTEDEKKFAESEINSFNEKPMDYEIDTIVSKIYAEIGKIKKSEEAQVSELNSKKDDVDIVDIFAEVCVESTQIEDEDINIF